MFWSQKQWQRVRFASVLFFCSTLIELEVTIIIFFLHDYQRFQFVLRQKLSGYSSSYLFHLLIFSSHLNCLWTTQTHFTWNVFFVGVFSIIILIFYLYILQQCWKERKLWSLRIQRKIPPPSCRIKFETLWLNRKEDHA